MKIKNTRIAISMAAFALSIALPLLAADSVKTPRKTKRQFSISLDSLATAAGSISIGEKPGEDYVPRDDNNLLLLGLDLAKLLDEQEKIFIRKAVKGDLKLTDDAIFRAELYDLALFHATINRHVDLVKQIVSKGLASQEGINRACSSALEESTHPTKVYPAEIIEYLELKAVPEEGWEMEPMFMADGRSACTPVPDGSSTNRSGAPTAVNGLVTPCPFGPSPAPAVIPEEGGGWAGGQ